MRTIKKITICITALLAIFVAQSAKATDAPEGYAYIPMIEEGKAWHYRVDVAFPLQENPMRHVKLELQGDVEFQGKTWKQCWFKNEDGSPLAKTPVALLREEDRKVYIYPIVNASTFYDDSGKYDWSDIQIKIHMRFYKVTEDNFQDKYNIKYPLQTLDEINEAYPAVLYDFNLKTGDSMKEMAGSQWIYLYDENGEVREDSYGTISDESYILDHGRYYRCLNYGYHDYFYEGIGTTGFIYFICPNSVVDQPTRFWEGSNPDLEYVTDGEGNVIYGYYSGISSFEEIEDQLIYSNGEILLRTDNNQPCMLKVYDISGQCVLEGQISSDNPIDVSDILLPGVYVARATGSNASCSLKFAIQKSGV